MSSVSSSKDAPSEAEAGHYDSETNHVVDNFMSNVSGRESSVRIKEIPLSDAVGASLSHSSIPIVVEGESKGDGGGGVKGGETPDEASLSYASDASITFPSSRGGIAEAAVAPPSSTPALIIPDVKKPHADDDDDGHRGKKVMFSPISPTSIPSPTTEYDDDYPPKDGDFPEVNVIEGNEVHSSDEDEDSMFNRGDSNASDKSAAPSTSIGRNPLLQNIRTFVSKKKNRHIYGSFNLDLTYITPRIIAMGYPSTGLESAYRNPAADVAAFLDRSHFGHFQVYNLCEERQYDVNLFHGRVKHFPFKDHDPPPFTLLPAICADMKNYWDKNEGNVIVVHCKAGKGRTGVVISSFMYHIGICKSAEDAFRLYSSKRTSNNKGVTIPSQIRYIKYFEKFSRAEIHDHVSIDLQQKVHIVSVDFSSSLPAISIVGSLHPVLKIHNIGGDKIFSSRKKGEKEDKKDSSGSISLGGDALKDCYFSGDVKISLVHESLTGDVKLFHFWINSGVEMAQCKGVEKKIVLMKDDLDGACKDTANKLFPADFQITLTLERVEFKENPVIMKGTTLPAEITSTSTSSGLSASTPSTTKSMALTSHEGETHSQVRHNNVKDENEFLRKRLEVAELTSLKALDVLSRSIGSLSSETLLLRRHLVGGEKEDMIEKLTKQLSLERERALMYESELELVKKEADFRGEERKILKRLVDNLVRCVGDNQPEAAKKVLKDVEGVVSDW